MYISLLIMIKSYLHLPPVDTGLGLGPPSSSPFQPPPNRSSSAPSGHRRRPNMGGMQLPCAARSPLRPVADRWDIDTDTDIDTGTFTTYTHDTKHHRHSHRRHIQTLDRLVPIDIDSTHTDTHIHYTHA